MSVMTQRNSTSTVPPDLLTVEEAARVLRIGRTNAYELFRRWLATVGLTGYRRYGSVICCGCHATGSRNWWVVRSRGRSPMTLSSSPPAPVTAIDTRRSARPLVDAAHLPRSHPCRFRPRSRRCQPSQPSSLTTRCSTDRCPPAAGVQSGGGDAAGVDVVRVVGGGNGGVLHPLSDGGAGGGAGCVVGAAGRRARAVPAR